ncbi:MAG: alpha/beta fold hydrolase [Acidobacteria bacterium]|nr:alpha/beta fold hydrolase [Acidobacteriota bacterium]MYH31337.1 alpha/beta fold hydrolase [Acidobacteriota bacterium]
MQRRLRTCLRLALCLSAAAATATAVRTQPPPDAGAGEALFNIFVRSTPAGFERVRVVRTGDGWLLQSSGQLTTPVPVDTRVFEAAYDTQWRPRQLTLEGSQAGISFRLESTFADGAATNTLQEGDRRSTTEAQIDPASVLLPNSVFASYEALAMRLADARPGAELPIYVPPRGRVSARVDAVGIQHIETAARTIEARTYRITFVDPSQPLDAEVWIDENDRLLRVSLPYAALEVARRDIASVSARLTTDPPHPGSERVRVPAAGFTLATTVTAPVDLTPPADGRWPAVLLVPGTGPVDRDEIVSGVPIFRQLAWTLTDRGFVVARYDKRGFGQSGGRAESAALIDYAQDVREMVRYLQRREDVDRDRIVAVGYGEGGWIGLLAARRENRIRGLALVATPGTTGATFVLEQQRDELRRTGTTGDQRQERIELQTRIHRAVLGDGGWDGIPDDMRRQADTPLFRSFLAFDPTDEVRRVRQPLLLIQGALDRLVPPYHAQRLQNVARLRGRRESTVELATLDGVNHLLLASGAEQNASPGNPEISPRVAEILIDWIERTLPAE